jgi:hypothetical protein
MLDLCKVCALELIEFLALYLDDMDNYHMTLPYIISLFEDSENQIIS